MSNEKPPGWRRPRHSSYYSRMLLLHQIAPALRLHQPYAPYEPGPEPEKYSPAQLREFERQAKMQESESDNNAAQP